MSNTGIRVLVLAEELGGTGGIQRSTLEIARGLSDRGFKILLAFGEEGELLPEWQDFVEGMIDIDATLLPRRTPLKSIRRLVRAVVFARRSRVEFVYSHSPRQMELAFLIALLARARHVHHARTRPPSNPRLRRIGRRAAFLVAVSESTRDEWIEEHSAPLLNEVVPNGVDLRRFEPASSQARLERRASLGLGATDFVVGYFGRIDPMKGLETLAGAWAKFEPIPDLPHRRLIFVGSPTAIARSRDFAETFSQMVDRASAIAFGHVNDVVPFIQVCDVTVAPSLYEPFGRVAIESLACGVPVVASDVGGLSSILDGELEWLLVEPGNVGQLAATLERVARDGAEPRQLRTRAERYSLAVTVDRVAHVFEALARSRGQ
jgi:glycosyltransferase involved in cell wall biosynthesis